ncbi:MAG TPA: hypothetical protein VK971_08640 [Thiohalobacter sp.]|nr:hypothetical protein [Thiohalobacter sp.]
MRIDTTDWSARLTGGARIEAEESAARIAEFALRPQAGALSVPDWVGAGVEIDLEELDGAGAVQQTTRLFTGLMDLPDYDRTQQVIRCRATDALQDRQEGMTQAAIETEIGGLWSEALFDAEADGWTYTQDRMSSQPYAFDLDAYGTPRLTAWATKALPDFTLTADDFLYESLAVELLPRRDLTNSITRTLQYRYNRRRHRTHTLGWDWQNGALTDFCDWLSESTTLPNRGMVLDAIEGTGWWIDTISFGQLPASGFNLCGNGVAWVISEETRAELVFNFSANLYKRIAHPVTEVYELTLQAPQSITQYGTLSAQTRGALQTESETDDWEEVEDAFLPAGGYTDGIGDWVLDMDDTAARDNAIQTALEVDRTTILAAHRRNRVNATLPVAPGIDLPHTVRVDDGQVRAQGKVALMAHVFDLDAGRAVTELALAVSRTGPQAPGTETPRTAPTPPDTTPAVSQPPSSSALNTQIGGRQASPAYDPDQNGYSGNYSVLEPNGVIYPVRFLAETPQIESEVRSNVEGTAQATYDMNIPQDLLEITVA